VQKLAASRNRPVTNSGSILLLEKGSAKGGKGSGPLFGNVWMEYQTDILLYLLVSLSPFREIAG
jgi:hypothetical protein